MDDLLCLYFWLSAMNRFISDKLESSVMYPKIICVSSTHLCTVALLQLQGEQAIRCHIAAYETLCTACPSKNEIKAILKVTNRGTI